MRLIFLFLILFSFTGFISCKSNKSLVEKNSEEKPPKNNLKKGELTERDNLKYQYSFHTANKEKILGNYDLAANLYAQCIKIDNTKATPFYELAGIYTLMGKNEFALEFAKQAAEIDPSIQWFSLQYANLLQKNGQHNKAVSIYEKMVKMWPGNIDYNLELANAFLLSGKTSEAMKVYDRVEALTGISEEISIQKQRIYISKGNHEKAVEETKKLIVAFPNEPRYYGMLADLYQSKGMDEKALETFNLILEFDPNNPYVHLSLADFYNRKDENEKAFVHLEKAFLNVELDIDTKVKILLSYYVITESKNDLKDEAFELAINLIKTHPKEAKSFAIYGDFLLREKKYVEAREQFRKAILYDKDKFVIWNQLLLLDSELNDFEAMEKESEQAIELFPTQPSLYLFNGIANIQLKNYTKAVEMLETGVILVIDNKPLKAQLYSSLGDVYNMQKKHPESDGSYELALAIEPNNYYVLNNYSYYLSLREEKLDRAAEMSKRSNELKPNNASFLDTYGWILYVQGNYPEAKIWLEKALENGGAQSSVILEHYGDTLFKLNEKQEAVQFWEKAKKAGGNSEQLDKKIKEKRIVEKLK
ncbi:MAG: tetratricopeptide repeat protein [Bacteroidetes bacterium]|nr:tetratricopeptide repeat protein [Bacteroidota bacterium]HET6245392.1 tetratricopeptide repeat protein [Bacteroidia bacterium]